MQLARSSAAMPPDVEASALTADGLRQFQMLRSRAVSVVAEQFWDAHGAALHQAGLREREEFQKDVAFCLDCLQPVLEFGVLQPMVDYLHWLACALAARSVPAVYIPLMLDLLGKFFVQAMTTPWGTVLVAVLHAARGEFLAAPPPPAMPSCPPDGWPETAAFEAHLTAGRQHEVLAIVNGLLDSGRSLIEVELHLIQPALYHIGERWQANLVSIAGEHMATAMAQLAMTVSLLRSPPSMTKDRRVLLACVAGNHHALGLRMVADAFVLGGWDVQYLGADMPASAIVGHAEKWKVDLVGLSVSFPHQLRAARQTVARLAERLGAERPPVIIGGLAINRFSRMAELVGADGWCEDAPAAVVLANQLVNARG